MMYPYIVFGDGTEVVHSQVLSEDGLDKVLVHFERPHAGGFDSTRCELPSYTWTLWEGGFTEAEREEFERFLRDNAAAIYLFAAQGGISVA